MARTRTPARPSADTPSLKEVVEDLTVEVQKLTGQVEVLRISVDDLRSEVEWAIRNIYRPAWAPTQPTTSATQDAPADAVAVPKQEAPPLTSDAPQTLPSQGTLWND